MIGQLRLRTGLGMQVVKWVKNVALTTQGKEEAVGKRKRPLSEAAGSAGKVQCGKGMDREGEGGGVVMKGDEKCPHNRQRSLCKECDEVGIYEHNRIRRTCKKCCGVGICEHNRQRSSCKE